MGQDLCRQIAPDAVEAIKRYLAVLPEFGIHPKSGILFGSFARGEEHEFSDIDLVVVAPEFDTMGREQRMALWHATVKADERMQPIPCGVYEWDHNETRPIIDIARREGIEIAA